MTTLTDAAGQLSRTYDERGNIVVETRSGIRNALGFSLNTTLDTVYHYDPANRLSRIRYPSGARVKYNRDKMGRLDELDVILPGSNASLPIASNISYEPFGPVTGLTYGNGVHETRIYDLDYREAAQVATFKDGTLQNLQYGYDAADNVRSIGDTGVTANSQTFQYDVLNRLTNATGAYGNFGWTYDPVGNLLTLSHGGIVATTYTYGNPNNQLTGITALIAITQSLQYTPAGNIGRITQSGSSARFSYNQANRLAQVSVDKRVLVDNNYDAFGQQLVKSGRGADTVYQHDPNGLLLEETTEPAGQYTDHIYLDDGTPVGQIGPRSGRIYFVLDDRLGTPQLLTNANQKVVWQAQYEPFGSADLKVTTVTQNLRLPGQLYDSDSNQYQNGFRDYIPIMGRYIESDPIGLLGGLNTYAYVGGNPIRGTDPKGLQYEGASPPPNTGRDWTWYPDASDRRGGKWRDSTLRYSASWDEQDSHWDIHDSLTKTDQRYDRWGNQLTKAEAHGYCGPKQKPILKWAKRAGKFAGPAGAAITVGSWLYNHDSSDVICDAIWGCDEAY